MERDEEDTGARSAGERDRADREGEAPGRLGNDAAGPDQAGDDGFAEGYDQVPDTAQENQKPNFARGVSHEDVPGTEHQGRFSEGQEQLPETPEKDAERRFSEGQERSPTSE